LEELIATRGARRIARSQGYVGGESGKNDQKEDISAASAESDDDFDASDAQ
jgi:hypothetical protein